VVYVGSDDDNVYALNATSGLTIWTYGTLNLVDSSPAVANGVVYVGSNDDNVYAFGAITVPQPSPPVPSSSPTIPEFPNQALDLSLVAIMACAAFAVIAAKKKRINGKILQG
jgi:outer membrane protein assembly factor BamB